MKRSRFVVLALATAVAANAAPLRAHAAAGGRVRLVRRSAYAAVPGRCANLRRTRWASFSAADFHVQASPRTLRSRSDWNGVKEC